MKRFISDDQLILNADGSIYHLNLHPEHLAETVITVGDPDRVGMVTRYFSNIEYEAQKREFHTQTGYFKAKRITVLSTGIGTDNIDIVCNELDALANIDLNNRTIKNNHKTLNFIRIGTSGAVHSDVEVDTFLVSAHVIGLDGLLNFYEGRNMLNLELSRNFNHEVKPPVEAYAADAHRPWLEILPKEIEKGITLTNAGFYAPQSRKIRLVSNLKLEDIERFQYQGLVITNLEMETAGIYGLARLLGHRAISFNAILANRKKRTFSKNPSKTIDRLIREVLHWISESIP